MQANITQYYHDLKNTWEQNATLSLETFEAEAIHKMRTSTKRLRTLFPFLTTISGGQFSGKKNLKAMNRFYKLSGYIRELQIEQLLISEYESKLGISCVEYKDYLTKRENIATKRFANIKDFKPSESTLPSVDEISVLNLDSEKTLKNIRIFFRKKMKRLFKLVKQVASNKRIHEIRRHLKQLYYLNDILGEEALQFSENKLDADRLREMEQYLGEWHDLVNSSHYMMAFTRTKNFEKSKPFVNLRKQISQDRLEMRHTIIQQFYPELKRAYGSKKIIKKGYTSTAK